MTLQKSVLVDVERGRPLAAASLGRDRADGLMVFSRRAMALSWVVCSSPAGRGTDAQSRAGSLGTKSIARQDTLGIQQQGNLIFKEKQS